MKTQMKAATWASILCCSFALGCAANQSRMKAGGAVAAAGFGAVAAASLVAAALGKGTAQPDQKLPAWPPAAVTTNVKSATPVSAPAQVVASPAPGRCLPPTPPPHTGCVSEVAEPHLDTPTCLYFCVDHCTYHAPAR